MLLSVSVSAPLVQAICSKTRKETKRAGKEKKKKQGGEPGGAEKRGSFRGNGKGLCEGMEGVYVLGLARFG